MKGGRKFNGKPTVSQKRREIGPSITSRKWHTPFQITRESVTLDNVEESECTSLYSMPIVRYINQSINQKITTYKSDQWCTTHLKTKIKPKDNVQKVKITQR